MKDLGIGPARSTEEWVMLRTSQGDKRATAGAALDDLLASRSTPAELAAQGVLKAPLGVSPVIAGPAHDLEGKLMRRYSIPEVEKSRILKAPISQAAESLERRMAADALNRGLTRRASAAELQQKGILKAPVGGAASALEQRMKADALGWSLTHRPSAEDLQEKGIMKGGAGMSPRLSEATEHLERRMKADAVNRKLWLRPEAEELEAKGILQNPMADTRKPLQLQMGSDETTTRLTLPPALHDLLPMCILKAPVGGAATKLERRMTADSLAHGLERRASAVALQARLRRDYDEITTRL